MDVIFKPGDVVRRVVKYRNSLFWQEQAEYLGVAVDAPLTVARCNRSDIIFEGLSREYSTDLFEYYPLITKSLDDWM